MPSHLDKLKLPQEVRCATQQDSKLIGEIIADAFSQDPVNKWIFKHQRGMVKTFTAYAEHVFGPKGLCHLIDDQSATMWCLSNISKELPFSRMPSLALSMVNRSGAGTISRALMYDNLMKKLRPKEQHLYLFTVGVRPSAQGKGYGKKILTPVLEACDQDNLPCYLESSNPDNHGFYASLGFETVTIQSPKEGLPPVETMWRKPNLKTHA